MKTAPGGVILLLGPKGGLDCVAIIPDSRAHSYYNPEVKGVDIVVE